MNKNKSKKYTKSYKKIANFSDLKSEKTKQICLSEALNKYLPIQQTINDIEEKLIEDWLKKSNDFLINIIRFAKRKKKKKSSIFNQISNYFHYLSLPIHFDKDKHELKFKYKPSWKLKLISLCFVSLIISLSVVVLAPNLSKKITSVTDQIFLAPIVLAFDIEQTDNQQIEINSQILANYILNHKDELKQKFAQGQTSIKIPEREFRGRVAGAYEESTENIDSRLKKNFEIVLSHASNEIASFMDNTFDKQKSISIKLNDKLIQIINSLK
jgi:hypothetical protein